jgi:hypothetical protein
VTVALFVRVGIGEGYRLSITYRHTDLTDPYLFFN